MKSEAANQNNAEHNDQWFDDFKKSSEYQAFFKQPVAYFSLEYELMAFLPTYAGGLGVLAGDYIREAASRNFPMLFVGLYYRNAQNNLTSTISHDENLITEAGLKLATNKFNERLLITLPIHDRIIKCQIWTWTKEGASLYLLDTNIAENQPHDRMISERLYTDDREIRLKQEILLGIGGFRLLEQLGFHCSVYHLNEGHSAFLVLEVIRHEMKHQRVDFHTAVEYARQHIIFTNHTLIAAGQEQFTTELVSVQMAQYAQEMEVSIADIVSLGQIEGSNLFSMTMLSFHLASRVNGVSRLHAQKAHEIWPQHPMNYVTNGIFLPNWDKVGDQNDMGFWEKHQENKKKLLSLIKNETGEVWDQNILLFGWARRIVPYKRPLAFLELTDQLLTMAKNTNKPFRIVFSGPTDNDGSNNELESNLKKIIEEKLKGIAVFLPNYNAHLASILTAGSDVWLNTPVVGSEACGTSGMKAMLNGALPLSTRDGWVAEADLFHIGWVIDEPNVGAKMLDIVAREIIPEYYDHLANPRGSKWSSRQRLGRRLIRDQFSMSRALKQYIEDMYIPTMAQKHG